MNKYNFSGSMRGKLRTLDAKLYMQSVLVQQAQAELKDHYKSIMHNPGKGQEQFVINETFICLESLEDAIEHAREMLAGALTHGKRLQNIKKPTK